MDTYVEYTPSAWFTYQGGLVQSGTDAQYPTGDQEVSLSARPVDNLRIIATKKVSFYSFFSPEIQPQEEQYDSPEFCPVFISGEDGGWILSAWTIGYIWTETTVYENGETEQQTGAAAKEVQISGEVRQGNLPQWAHAFQVVDWEYDDGEGRYAPSQHGDVYIHIDPSVCDNPNAWVIFKYFDYGLSTVETVSIRADRQGIMFSDCSLDRISAYGGADYMFHQIFSNHGFFLCDTEGNILTHDYDDYPTGVIGVKKQFHSDVAISVSLALSSDSDLGAILNNDYPALSGISLYDDYHWVNQDNSSMLGRFDGYMPDITFESINDQYPLAMTYGKRDSEILVASRNAQELAWIGRRVRAKHPAGLTFAGFIGFAGDGESLSVASIADPNVVFLQAFPFREGGRGFVPAPMRFFPVFIDGQQKCVYDFVCVRPEGKDQEFIYTEFSESYGKEVRDAAFGGRRNYLYLSSDTAGGFDAFEKNMLSCARFETTLLNVYAHGTRQRSCEGTVLCNKLSSENDSYISNNQMRNFIDKLSKNVIYRSTCCFGAGTFMRGNRKHVYPEQFLPGLAYENRTEYPQSPDGKSIMYILDDISTSPSWSINKQSFGSLAVMAFLGKDLTYRQFAEKYMQLVKTYKKAIFKGIRALYKEFFSEKCLYAKLENGQEITNDLWRLEALRQNSDMLADLRNCGIKYPLNVYYEDGSSAECYDGRNGVFWRIFRDLAWEYGPQLDKLFNMFKDQGVAPNKIDGKLDRNYTAEEKQRLGFDPTALFKDMFKMFMGDGLQRSSPSQIISYYRNAGDDRIAAVREWEKKHFFKEETFLAAKCALKLDFVNMALQPHYEEIEKCDRQYRRTVRATVVMFLKEFYKIYLEVSQLLQQDLGTVLQRYGVTTFSFIFLTLTFDFPTAGFIKATPEFLNRKFLT